MLSVKSDCLKSFQASIQLLIVHAKIELILRVFIPEMLFISTDLTLVFFTCFLMVQYRILWFFIGSLKKCTENQLLALNDQNNKQE